MSHPPNPYFRYSWRLPVLGSFLIHAGLIVPLVVGSVGPGKAGRNGPLIDTVVLEDPCHGNGKLENAPRAASVVSATSIQSVPGLVTTEGSSPAFAEHHPLGPASAQLPSFAEPNVGTGETQEEPGAPTPRAERGTGLSGRGRLTTSFFNVETEGQSIVYVIDRSASMGLDGSYEAAKRELMASLSQLPDSARFQVIVYNRTAEPLLIDGRAELARATSENKRRVDVLLRNLYAEGGTEHVRALRRALALHAEVVFFFTDADNLRAEQVRMVTLANHGGSVIHAIELNSGKAGNNPHPLRLLAEQNHGIYRTVSIPHQ